MGNNDEFNVMERTVAKTAAALAAFVLEGVIRDPDDEANLILIEDEKSLVDYAAELVDGVLAEFGLIYEPKVNTTGYYVRSAELPGHERITMRARPGSQFRFVADDPIAKASETPDNMLVSVVFHDFNGMVSNTTIAIGSRATADPAVPTVAYIGNTKPVVRKM